MRTDLEPCLGHSRAWQGGLAWWSFAALHPRRGNGKPAAFSAYSIAASEFVFAATRVD